MTTIDLSVLICSVHTRYKTFGPKIQSQVWEQYNALPPEYQERIEIIMLTDNKKMMLGEKRNIMVDMAQGRYVQFVDDDDRIALDMFRVILDAITEHPADVITFLVSVSMNGEDPKPCEYSLRFPENRNTDDGYERLPNHICVLRADKAKQVSFPNKVYGEDSIYAHLLRPHLETEHHIPRVLYFYDWSAQHSETQEHRPGALRMRGIKPVVDVIIMSKASSMRLRQMTQYTIDTCIAGANSLPVHVIVVEQQKGVRYQHAQTVFAGDEFNYNRFANRAAGMGFAKWIMVANSDLEFHDGWLHELLVADYPVVSPKNDLDMRQAHITENTKGWENAEHFSGWCFMISRDLWRRIDCFDETVRFWCSDDVVIEQLRRLRIPPMLVPAARVDHSISATLGLVSESEHDELTWGQVEIFNRKYGANKFVNDKRYLEWRKKNANSVKSNGVLEETP